MATSSHQIKCINKSDRTNIHERIINIGGTTNDGTRWKIAQQKAIDGIESGELAFYVLLNSAKVNVIVATSQYGYKYLKTESDNTTTNNLLSLPECP